MAVVKIRNLSQLRKNLNAKFKIVINKTLRSKNLRDQVGKVVAQDIRDNFENGTSVLASPITQAFREFLEQYNSTHPDYRRRKINITFTGELLNDLASNVKADTINLGFIIEHSNKKHSTYKSGGTFAKKTVKVTSLKTKKTTDREQKLTHRQISDHVIARGYDYLKVSDKGKKEILKLVQKEILANIKQVYA